MALMLSVQTSSADEEDLIRLDNGLLRKVIVSEDEAKLFPDGPGVGDGVAVKAFSIYFILKGSDDDYVRVGDGMEIGWISENAVIEWNTRFFLQPITPDPAKPDAVFRIISSGAIATFIGAVGSDKQKVVVPILEPVTEGKNPDYKVAYFAGPLRVVGAKKTPVGRPPIKSIKWGTAKLRSDDGDLLARQMVMVSELDLRRLRSTLELLLLQLKNKPDPARIDNIGQLLERLQVALVLLVTGQDLSEDTFLGGVITGLPLSTEVLKMSREDLASMTKSDFKEWLTSLEGARKRAASLLEDEETDWYQLSGAVENAKFAFIPLEYFP
jgi:hypothetical protein